MKKLIVIVLFLQIILCPLASTAQALEINVEKERLTTDSYHFTFGLGWAANEFLGGIAKDGLGYPRNSMGLNTWLGFSYTWIYGAPLKQEILNAIDAVVAENGGAEGMNVLDLKKLTKKKLGDRSYTYFRIGSIILLYPLVAQYGWMIPLGDNVRFQFGLGLPVLLNVGINFDF